MPSNLNAVVAGFFELIKHPTGLLDIWPLPFHAQPPVSSRDFDCQFFLQCLQKLKIVRVQILECPCVIELKRLGFYHQARICKALRFSSNSQISKEGFPDLNKLGGMEAQS